MKRKNGRKYYPPSEFVPADVGPDGKVVVPVKAEASFKETAEERREREAEEEREELERKVREALWSSVSSAWRHSFCSLSLIDGNVSCQCPHVASWYDVGNMRVKTPDHRSVCCVWIARGARDSFAHEISLA